MDSRRNNYSANIYRINEKLEILVETLRDVSKTGESSYNELFSDLLNECSEQIRMLFDDVSNKNDAELVGLILNAIAKLYNYLENSYFNKAVYTALHNSISEWESLNNRVMSSIVAKYQLDNVLLVDKSLAKFSEKVKNVHDEINALVERSYNQISSVLRDGIEEIDSKVRIVSSEIDVKLKQFDSRIKKFTDEESENRKEFHDLIESEILRFDEEIKNRVYVSVQRFERTALENFEQMEKSKEHISQLFLEHSEAIRKISNETKDEAISSIMRDSSVVIDEIKTEQSKGLSSFNNKIDNQVASIEKKITDVVNSFDSRRQDMDNLLEKVGLARDAEVTIIQADKEEKTADSLRFYGCILLYVSIVALVILFAEYVGLNFWSETTKSIGDLTFQAFLIRFFTVILISSPAVYLLKESASHRAKENIYRQRGTQLLTIRGYLSDLPDIERAEVKKSLAENFFSINNGKVDTSNVPDFIKNMGETMRVIRSLKDGEFDKRINKSQ